MTLAEDFLTTMARSSEERARALRAGAGGQILRRRALDAPLSPALRLSGQGFDVIAEIKMNSPSAGVLSKDAGSLESRAETYARAGACAVSVLTEPERFGGSTEHLRRAAEVLAALEVPAMAKDFIVAPEQVFEARAAGAGGVLLIIRMLDEARLTELLDLARELGMFVLLEAFDRPDLERAAPLADRQGHALPPVLLGLNCRNLRTLEVDNARFRALAERFPAGFPRVAESGIEGPQDAAAAAATGYSVVLIGTALMRSAEPGALVTRILEAGRAARRAS